MIKASTQAQAMETPLPKKVINLNAFVRLSFIFAENRL